MTLALSIYVNLCLNVKRICFIPSLALSTKLSTLCQSYFWEGTNNVTSLIKHLPVTDSLPCPQYKYTPCQSYYWQKELSTKSLALSTIQVHTLPILLLSKSWHCITNRIHHPRKQSASQNGSKFKGFNILAFILKTNIHPTYT